MTDGQIRKEIKRIDEISSTINSQLIEDGFGNVRFNDLHKINHPLVPGYLALTERRYRLSAVGERRYGSGWRF